MSLPYGPIKRGLTISWIAGHIRSELDRLKNVKGAYPFKGNPRLVGLHVMDPRVVTQLNEPIARITFGRADMANSPIRGVPEVIYEKGGIVHEGTGTEAVELQGSHQGNNRYVCEITASGTVGTDGSYELRKTPWTGTDWGEEEIVSSGAIPASGEIETGDGTLKIVFAQEEEVVQGDTYSWETEAYRVSNVNGRAIRQRVTIDISIMFADESSIDEGYLDQLFNFFRERQLAIETFPDHYLVVEQELRALQPQVFISGEEDEKEPNTEMFITLELEFRGPNDGAEPVAFTAEISPLIRKLEAEEPTIPD